MYQVRRTHRSQFLPIRHLRYHVQHWDAPGCARPPLVLLHGWMDVAASWQFLVDALPEPRPVIAPDWRGFGRTEVPGADTFWFADYLADLDFLLDALAPGQAVDLVGHSMGGQVGMMYAGVRPDRVRRLVNLEGFGLPATVAAQAPGRYVRWLDELHQLHGGAMELRAHEDLNSVARRLQRNNPRLSEERAAWLAQHWAAQDADGRWRILGSAGHKVGGALLYRVEETDHVLRRITAPVLVVEAESDSLAAWWAGRYTRAEFHDRMASVPNLRITRLAGTGHMLHHDQPEALAALIEDFLRG